MEDKKDPKMIQHYTLEYQEIYPDLNYYPIITLLGLLFLILSSLFSLLKNLLDILLLNIEGEIQLTLILYLPFN